MKYEFFIGRRYLRSKRRQKFISIIGFISIAGVIIGVMALNVVLAVMSGFEEELKDKILGINSHIVILTYEGAMENYDEITDVINKDPRVIGTSPFIYGQAMLAGDVNVSGAIIRGIDVENAGKVTNIETAVGKGSTYAPEGKLDDSEYKKIGKDILHKLTEETDSGRPPIIVGHELATNVGIAIGSFINLVSPYGKIGPFGQRAKIKKFEVIGSFDYGMYEYDSSLAYISLSDAMNFFDMEDKVTGIELKVKDIYESRDIGQSLMQKLEYPFYSRNWEEVNKSLFKALQLERLAIAIFLSLIVLVAALNIVSTLTMVVMEKGRDIAILRAMGATQGGIMRIFIIDGMIIGFVGTFLGSVIGYTFLYLIETHDFIKNLIPFDPKVYPISEFPVRIEPTYFLVVGLVSLIICFLATLYPSYQASKKDPVDALRYG